MRTDVFSIVSYNYVGQLIESATADVRTLPLEVLLDPSLAGKLDAIAAKYTPQYLVLQNPTAGVTTPDAPRTDSFTGHEFRSSTLSVTIPFTGDEQLLSVKPSRFSVPNFRFEVRGKNFLLHIPHDDNARQRVDQFVQHMRENFAVMRQDFDRGLPRLRQTLDQVASQRRQELERNKTSAERLGFPVREAK